MTITSSISNTGSLTAFLRAAALLAVATLLPLLAGCGSGGPASPTVGTKRFVFLTNTDDPFWDACNAGLVEGAKQVGLAAKNLRMVMEKNDATTQGQIERLRQFGSQADIVGVAVSAIQADNAALAEEMRNLAKKGIKVITVDGDLNREKFRDARAYYVGSDNAVAGRLLGQATKAILAARGKDRGGYVQFVGFTDNDNARSRMDGVRDALGTGYTEVDRMADQTDLSRARDNVRTALGNHPDVVALFGIWSYNAPAIAEVVEERSVRDRLTIATFDAQAAALDRMAAGKIDVMVVQNPFEMGVQTVRLLLAMHTDDTATLAEMFPNAAGPDGDVFTTGLRVVVPDEKPLLERDQIELAQPFEFLSLSAFRAWLAKYGLSSS
ncbi:MAG: substrate-binding domain-containing protein [Planctomycetia bacterium]|jgi:ribose transport system substrate-binding protein